MTDKLTHEDFVLGYDAGASAVSHSFFSSAAGSASAGLAGDSAVGSVGSAGFSPSVYDVDLASAASALVSS
jgi:hypothetical protein